MNPARLMTMPCTLVTITATGPVDEYNNPTEVSVDTVTTCWLHQSKRSEADGTVAETQDESWRVYLPPSVTPTGWSRLDVDGMTLEFDGPPWKAYNPRLGEHTHFECTARRTR